MASFSTGNMKSYCSKVFANRRELKSFARNYHDTDGDIVSLGQAGAGSFLPVCVRSSYLVLLLRIDCTRVYLSV